MDESLNPVNAGQEPVVEAQAAEPVTPQAEPVTQAQGENADPAEQQQEKPKQTPEENAKYAAARRKAEAEAAQKVAEAESKARDKTVSDIAASLGWKTRDGKTITTFEEFEIAKRDSELQQKGIDPAVVSELIQNDPTIRKANEVLAAQEKQKATQAEWSDFFSYFREEHGRNFDPAKDTLPQEVLSAQANGAKLKDAYVTVRIKELKAEKAELEKKLAAQETNAKNAGTAVGSVKGDGAATGGDFITYDAFEANKHDQKWVIKNLPKITVSRAKW